MDPLAEALSSEDARNKHRTGMKIDLLFGARPDVIDSIKKARMERCLSFQHIATILSQDGEAISAGAVQNWLRNQGIQ